MASSRTTATIPDASIAVASVKSGRRRSQSVAWNPSHGREYLLVLERADERDAVLRALPGRHLRMAPYWTPCAPEEGCRSSGMHASSFGLPVGDTLEYHRVFTPLACWTMCIHI